MLIYDEPGKGGDQPRPGSRPAPGDAYGLSVRDMMSQLWRRRWLILAAGFVFAALGVTLGRLVPPRFVASAQLLIDPRELQIVSSNLTPVTQDSTAFTAIVESKSRIMTAQTTLKRVVEKLKLDTDPEFGGQGTGVVADLLQALGMREDKPSRAGGDQQAAIEALDRRITVRRADRTFIVDVLVTAATAEKSAVIANALVDAFLAEEAAARADAARRASDALSSRLGELRERLRVAEDRVQIYKQQKNIIGTRDVLSSDQQLSELTQQLGLARTRLAEVRARYEQIQASRGSAADGAIAEALNSPTMATLRGQLADLKRREADLRNQLGPRHPTLQSAAEQSREVQRLIQAEIARVVALAKNELETAVRNEAALTARFNQLQRRTVESEQASVELRELERDVEVNRGLYEAFLRRARETSEQERLDTGNTRVLSVASPPRFRSFPPRGILLAIAGFIVGFGLGSALALLAEWLRSGPVDPPGSTLREGPKRREEPQPKAQPRPKAA